MGERHPKRGGQPWRSPNGGRTARCEKAGRGGWRKKCREGHGGGEGREDERRARRTSGPSRPRLLAISRHSPRTLATWEGFVKDGLKNIRTKKRRREEPTEDAVT